MISSGRAEVVGRVVSDGAFGDERVTTVDLGADLTPEIVVKLAADGTYAAQLAK